jgi:DNA-binding response OmpR family regulator
VTRQKAKRVLIVEDEFLVALHLEDLLIDMGHEVIGPAHRLDDALDIARTNEFDFAVLDVNLAGTPSFPVAEILRERRIPFVFATGYGSEGLIDGYRHETALRKPYEAREIADAILRAFPQVNR